MCISLQRKSIQYLEPLILLGSWEGWSQSLLTLGKRVHPGQVPVHHRADTKRQTTIHAHTGRKSPINLHVYRTVGVSRSIRRKPTYARVEHVNFTQRGHSWSVDSNPDACEATVVATKALPKHHHTAQVLN